MKKGIVALAAIAALAIAALGGTAFGGTDAKQAAPAVMAHNHATVGQAPTAAAANLRVKLDRLLGEHTLLAITATQRGLQGGKDFPALGKSLDRNSVQLANTIGSVFGKAAGNQFLNGKFMWRDHIEFFVDYTVAKAKNDRAGQQRAVRNLTVYIATFSSFLSKATGLPLAAVRASITEHVMQLKGQLDAFASGNYTRSYAITREAYAHMFMTGDTLAGAIVKKFPQKFGS